MWEVVNDDETQTAIDSTIFTFDELSLTIITETDEIAKAQTYDLMVKVYYTDYPYISQE